MQLKNDLEFSRYVQVHQYSSWNLLHLGVRLSRSRPVQALLVGGKSRPASDSAGGSEHWDMVEEFWYPTMDALVRSWAGENGAAIKKKLASDQSTWVGETAVIIGEHFNVLEDASRPAPQLAIVFCLRRSTDISRGEMLDYWSSSHKNLFMSQQGVLGFRGYGQMHASDAKLRASVAANYETVSGEVYDGVASVHYGSQGELLRSFLNPFAHTANIRVLRDEANFVDGRRSVLVFGRRYLFGD